MDRVSVAEIKRDFAAYLQRVEAGETLVITRGGEAVAEITPAKTRVKALRPFGLYAGEFRVSDDFDRPLPEDVFNSFEGQ